MRECVRLQPAKIRGTFLLRDAEKPAEEFDWKSLCARLDPENSRPSKMNLRGARPGDFIGTRRKAGRIVNFLISIRSESESNIEWLLRRIPDFEESLCEIFCVEHVVWDAQMIESAA